MLKITLPVLAILLAAAAARGQTPQTAQDYLDSSTAHFLKGDADKALADVNKAIEMSPNHFDAFALRAAIRRRNGDAEGALADYSKAIELAPSAPGVEAVYHNRSMLRLRKGDVNGALDDLNKAISINPKVAELYNGRAVARLQKGDPGGSLADYEKVIELKPTLPSAFIGRGYFRFQKRDFDGALADFDQAIAMYADYADAYVERGIVRGLKGDVAGAIADIKKAASLSPKSVSDAGRGNFQSPFDDMNQFVASNPTDARAYAIRGILRLMQGKDKEAGQDFDKSLRLDPKLKPEIDVIIKEVKPAVKPQ